MLEPIQRFLTLRTLAPWESRRPVSNFQRWVRRVWLALFLLGLLSFVFWRFLLYVEVKSQFATLRKAGLPTSGAELNDWLPVLPESENGAEGLQKAFTLKRTLSDSRSNLVTGLLEISRTDLLNQTSLDLANEFLALNQPALAQAKSALQFHRFRFPLDYSFGPDTQLPHVSELKGLASTFALQSWIAADQKNASGATSDIKSILGLADTLREEPILLSHLVRNSIIIIAAKTLERNLSLGEMDATTASDLQRAFASVNNSNLLSRALIGELAISIPVFRLNRAEIEAVSGQDEDGSTRPHTPQQYTGKPNPFLWFTGVFERDLAFFMATMRKAIALATNPPPDILRLSEHFRESATVAQRKYYIMSNLLLPALDRVALREANVETNLRLAITTLAIERFRRAKGRLPTHLDELVPDYLDSVPADSFDGKPLRFLPQSSGYVVYGVGADLHDDNGREPPRKKKTSDQTTYDITFTVER